MNSRDLKLTLDSLRAMNLEALVALREDVEKALSERRVAIERSLLEIDGLIPRTIPTRVTLH